MSGYIFEFGITPFSSSTPSPAGDEIWILFPSTTIPGVTNTGQNIWVKTFDFDLQEPPQWVATNVYLTYKPGIYNVVPTSQGIPPASSLSPTVVAPQSYISNINNPLYLTIPRNNLAVGSQVTFSNIGSSASNNVVFHHVFY